jgi:hypothetical protein
MITIDPNDKTTYDYKFTRAVRKALSCVVYRLEEQSVMGDSIGNKGDWLVRDRNGLKIIPNRFFIAEYTTEEIQQTSERKRIPKVEQGEIVDTTVIATGRRGNTDIRKQIETSTYFIDDKDNMNNRDAAPYAYLSLHCPFSEANVTSGAYIEDILDVLIDHVKSAVTKRNARGTGEVLAKLYNLQRHVFRFGIGQVEIKEDRRPSRPERAEHRPKPCCGKSKEE